MHDAERQAAFGYGGIAQNRMLGVQQDHFENLVAEVSQRRMIVLNSTRLEEILVPSIAEARRPLPSSSAALTCAAFAPPTPSTAHSSSIRNGPTRRSAEPIKHFHAHLHGRDRCRPTRRRIARSCASVKASAPCARAARADARLPASGQCRAGPPFCSPRLSLNKNTR